MGYHVSDANSYLVVTGGGIKDINIVKKACKLPMLLHQLPTLTWFGLLRHSLRAFTPQTCLGAHMSSSREEY